jgi:hypothetical protein
VINWELKYCASQSSQYKCFSPSYIIALNSSEINDHHPKEEIMVHLLSRLANIDEKVTCETYIHTT